MARLSLGSLVLALCLFLAGPAQAANEQITGKLSKGHTLIVLGKNAKSKTFRGPGKFELKAPAKTSTLHLRGPDGSYAGPVVIKQLSKTKLVMGVKPGAKLGAIKIRKGYATTGRKVGRKYLAAGRTAKARKGKPLGAGNYGRVRTGGKGRAAQSQADAGAGEDPDGDGVPNVFDADNDGDLNLDNTDPPSGGNGPACASPPGPQDDPSCASEVGFWIFSQFLNGVSKTINANGEATREQIDRVISGADSGDGPDYNPGLSLIMQVPPGDSVELDCGGLTYCNAGGTGQVDIFSGSRAGTHPFPDDFDGDGDGFGNMTQAGRDGPGGTEFTLLPHATSSQIGPGDTFIERVTGNAAETLLPGSIVYVFNTHPALVAWSDGKNAGTISYPAPADPPGSQQNPILVEPDAQGHIVFTMTIWRPQRASFPNEPGAFVDIGHLAYPISSPSLPQEDFGGPSQQRLGTCNASTISSSDPDLKAPSSDREGGWIDQSDDAPPSPTRTLSFSIDLTQCLNGKNEEEVVDTWDSGELFDLTLQAKTRVGDNGGQRIFLKRK